MKQNLEKALGTSGQPVTWGTMAHDHEIYMTLTDTAVELRDVDALRKYPALLVEVAGRDDHKLYLAIAYRALGLSHRLAGRYTEAETLLRQGLALFKELHARWQMGRTLVELAELELRRSQNKDRSREYYGEALDMFEDMQAVPYVERTRAALESLAKA